MRFRIIIPSRTLIDAEAELVTMPGSKGVFGVMPGHSKFITNIKKGIVSAKIGRDTKQFYVHGGVAQIDEDELSVLGEFAEDLNDVRDTFVKDKINNLNLSLKETPEDSLEAKIIQNKIAQLEELRKHIVHV